MQSERQARRDPRVDVLRGLALLMIFVDHVPSDVLGWGTLHIFGLSDAAEVFVILSGFSSMAAYGQIFDHQGARAGLRRVAARCLRIYLFQAGLLVAAYLVVAVWAEHYYVLIPELIPFMNGGAHVVKHGLVLGMLPAKLDILPLYIVLFGSFPLIYLAMRWNMAVTLMASAAIWLVANLDHNFNFTNHMDGQGWFFDPFAWQFIFVLGAAGYQLMKAFDGSLPYRSWLAALCWGYLFFALVAMAPWNSWGLWDYRPFTVPADKGHLAVLRVIDVLAMLYLALSSDRFLKLTQSRRLAWIDACGRHSLEVFSLATLLALVGGLAITSFGRAWPMQIVVNLAGFAALIGLALTLEARRGKTKPAQPLVSNGAAIVGAPEHLSQSGSCVPAAGVDKHDPWLSQPAAPTPAPSSSLQPS